MRLWSLDPALVDGAALVACRREGLPAQKVLQGRTAGYRNHPQLLRFKGGDDPESFIAAFLGGIANEADRRGYSFNRDLIQSAPSPDGALTVTSGQLALEMAHLRAKVENRDPVWLPVLDAVDSPRPIASSSFIDGPVESWERADGGDCGHVGHNAEASQVS